MPGIDEASCYDLAHIAQAEESDIHCDLRVGQVPEMRGLGVGTFEQASLPLVAPG
jgi:hypothetical protein